MKKYSTKIGWVGTVFILLAYLLLSFNLILSNSLVYQLMNLFGALGIVVDTYYKKDKPPEVLNIIWAIIALIAILRILFINLQY